MQLRSNWPYFILSLGLAMFSWYMVAFEQNVESTLVVPLEIVNPPQGMVIRKGLVPALEVRISGPRSLVRTAAEKRLAYTLDLSQLKPGENITNLKPQNIPVGRSLEIIEMSPAKLTLVAEELATATVPVKPSWKGDLPDDWLLKESATDPTQARIKGPKSVVGKVAEIRTQTVVIAAPAPELYQEKVSLDVPPEIEADPAQVEMLLVFGPRSEETWIKVPLTVVADNSRSIQIDPDSVRLRLDAPTRQLYQENDKFRSEIQAEVRVPANLGPGVHELPFRVSLPSNTHLLEAKPPTVNVIIRPRQDGGGQAGGSQPRPMPLPMPEGP